MNLISKAQEVAAKLTALEKDEEQLRLEREAESHATAEAASTVEGNKPRSKTRHKKGLGAKSEANRPKDPSVTPVSTGEPLRHPKHEPTKTTESSHTGGIRKVKEQKVTLSTATVMEEPHSEGLDHPSTMVEEYAPKLMDQTAELLAIQNQGLVRQIQSLEQEVKQLCSVLEERDKEVTTLKTTVREQRSSESHLKDDIRALEEKLQRTQQEFQAAVSQCERQAAVVQKHHQESETLQLQLAAQREEIQRLEAELRSKADITERLQQQMGQLQKDLNAQEASSSASLLKEYREREEDLRRQLEGMQTELRTAKEDNKRRSASAERHRISEQGLQREMQELRIQLHETKEELFKLSAMDDQHIQREQDLHQQVTKLQAELANAHQLLSAVPKDQYTSGGQATEDIAQLQQELQAAREEVTRWVMTAEQWSKSEDRFQTDNERLQTEVTKLRQALSETTRRDEDQHQRMTELKSRLHLCETELAEQKQKAHLQLEPWRRREADLRSEIDRLNASLATKPQVSAPESSPTSTDNDWQERISDLQERLAHAQASASMSDAQYQAAKANIEQLKAQAVRAEEVIQLQKQLVAKEDDIVDLQQLNNHLSSQVEDLQLKWRRLQQDQQRTRGTSQDAVDKLKEEHAHALLQMEVKHRQALTEAKEQYAQLLEEANEPLKDRLAELEAELVKCKAEAKQSRVPRPVPQRALQDVTLARTAERQMQMVQDARKLGLAAWQQEPTSSVRDSHGFVYASEQERRRWDATLEYLKNVTLQFLCTNNAEVRRRLIPVLATVLNFTASEVQHIQRANRLWRPDAGADPWTLIMSFLNTL